MEKKGKKKEKGETKREGTGDNRTVSVFNYLSTCRISYHRGGIIVGRNFARLFFVFARLVGEGRQWPSLTCSSAQFRDFIRKRRR